MKKSHAESVHAYAGRDVKRTLEWMKRLVGSPTASERAQQMKRYAQRGYGQREEAADDTDGFEGHS